MKTLKNWALLFSCAVVMFAGGCKKEETSAEKCKNVTCNNGGTCVDGTCNCATGYTGTFCDNLIDPCANTTCQNGGTATVDSNSCYCVCVAGYEGTNCETESREKYFGTYSVNETCSSGTDTYNITIAANSGAVTRIVISNLYDAGFTLIADVDGLSITIPSQIVSGITISGNGSFNNNILSLSFTLTNGSSTEICTATCIKL